MPIEMTITIKDDSITHKEKHLVYDTLSLSKDSPDLNRYVDEAMDKFAGDKLNVDVNLRFNMIW